MTENKQHMANLFHMAKEIVERNKENSLTEWMKEGEVLAALHEAGKDVWTAYDPSLTTWKRVCVSLGKQPSNVLNHISYVKRFGKLITDENIVVTQQALRVIAPLKLEDKSQALDWLHSAATLTYSDLKKKVKEHRGIKLVENCPHSKRERWFKCSDCGHWERG